MKTNNLIEYLKNINKGICEKPSPNGSIKTFIIGIKRTVTGILSRNPERTDVKINTITLSKKILFGAMVTTKSDIIAISPTLSKQNIRTNRLIKKNGNLKSTLVK